ncbi:hypothetical protein BCR36DRAFT_440996 [Piromyces finnis]|uniref:CS domain-containing protein n=1 Tax=Piromyces finnis TaxID=1754191 RepID=A0A1Y1VFL1_9FUNG|nr:hypothetical protein BCR36DRAFT_440996 [Piromyces finnis]|eukprot:ORX54232.1 hypothetical protein BCR36DRAFT_440996 [Piromyces finnis]
MDENGKLLETEDNLYKKTTEETQEGKNEKKEEKEEEIIKKITDYAIVMYENAKIPYSKIHQTMEQLEILLYIPDVSLSTIENKFLGNTFYLEAKSQKDNQLYQYLIKLASPVNINECGFMVIDIPDDREIIEEEKEKTKPGITRTVKAIKCLLPKMKSEWWSNNIFEIRPKLINSSEDKKEHNEKSKTPLEDYIYKDGETNTDLFDFNEKIFLTENFVNKLDELLTKQEKEPKNKQKDEMPQWLRDAINPPKKENKVIELTEEDLITESATETITTSTNKTKMTEPEITLKANELIFDLDDIDF